jgi:hypothetical protein
MGHIMEKIKKFFFLRFCMDLHYKATVWVIFWKKKKKNCVSVWTYTLRLKYGSYYGEIKKIFFLRFRMELYYKTIVWVIFWRKIKKFFFAFLYGLIL